MLLLPVLPFLPVLPLPPVLSILPSSTNSAKFYRFCPFCRTPTQTPTHTATHMPTHQTAHTEPRASGVVGSLGLLFLLLLVFSVLLLGSSGLGVVTVFDIRDGDPFLGDVAFPLGAVVVVFSIIFSFELRADEHICAFLDDEKSTSLQNIRVAYNHWQRTVGNHAVHCGDPAPQSEEYAAHGTGLVWVMDTLLALPGDPIVEGRVWERHGF